MEKFTDTWRKAISCESLIDCQYHQTFINPNEIHIVKYMYYRTRQLSHAYLFAHCVQWCGRMTFLLFRRLVWLDGDDYGRNCSLTYIVRSMEWNVSFLPWPKHSQMQLVNAGKHSIFLLTRLFTTSLPVDRAMEFNYICYIARLYRMSTRWDREMEFNYSCYQQPQCHSFVN